MRTPMIAGNWKMNTNLTEAVRLVTEIRSDLEKIDNLDKVVCPPFISLAAVHDILSNSNIKVGAQNVYFQDKGAFTGEISPLMLVGICEYVIIGHSERRQYFNETGELISKKIASALKNNLNPILCIGENLNQYEAGETNTIVSEQINSSLNGIMNVDALTIAYEPIWAIGTGKAATGKQANDTISFIRSLISEKYSQDLAQNMRILYGGSVNANNIAEFVSESDIDGALVGGASLKAQDFININLITSKIRRNT